MKRASATVDAAAGMRIDEGEDVVNTSSLAEKKDAPVYVRRRPASVLAVVVVPDDQDDEHDG